MTSLTQLIEESTKVVSPDTRYSLRPGEHNALVMTLCANNNVSDFDEAMDMLQKFDNLSPMEQHALAMRIAEIAKDSDKIVGYHHIAGPLVNIWVRNRETREIELDIIADESNGRMLAMMNDHVIAVQAVHGPEPKPHFKEGDL
jgi:hypothetical protein